MSYVSIFLIVLLYLVIAFLIIGIVSRRLQSSWWIVRYFLKALFYSLLFGLGETPGGGDPGYDQIAPIPLAAWYATSSEILNNAIFPFIFWWLAIFLAMVVSRKIIHEFN